MSIVHDNSLKNAPMGKKRAVSNKRMAPGQPNRRLETVGDITIVTYLSDTQAIVENPDTLNELAQCYCDVFNEGWGESWTIEAAKKVIRSGLVPTDKRKAIAVLLFHEHKIIGFYLCIMIATDDITKETMPVSLSSAHKMKGVQVAQYWLKNIVKKKGVFYI